MADRGLKLSEMISNLKAEIKSAQTSEDTMFELGQITIKTKIAIKARGKAGAKASFYVVTADLGGGIDSENSHEVTIVLNPIGSNKLFMGNNDR
jgi:hypothetical protein